MPRSSPTPDLPLPRGWTKHVKSGFLHAVSLASAALTAARGLAPGTKRSQATPLHAELEQANREIALLREELAIKDARWGRSNCRRRPHYRPVERMRILELKAARHWNLEQTAQVFLIDEHTLRTWMRTIDDPDRSLVQLAEPVNKFPDFVRRLVQRLSVLAPAMGKIRIAQVLARAGLQLGVTTVGRILRETRTRPTTPVTDDQGDVSETRIKTRIVTAKRPGETIHVDMTTIPIRSGFWVPWIPFALPLDESPLVGEGP